MPISSRSSRPPRRAGGQFAKSNNVAPVAKAPPSNSISHQHHHHNAIINTSSDNYSDASPPPAKKRKLSIRHKHNTLDNFVPSLSAQTRPPTKVSVAQPHGQLLETLNGVRTALDADEDELGKATEATGTPDRVSQTAKATTDKKEDKRTLRSQGEGPRLKSELAIYFPSYEEIILDVQKEPEFITTDTVVYVIDDAPRQTSSAQPGPQKLKGSPAYAKQISANGVGAPSTPQKPNPGHFNSSSLVDLHLIARTLPDKPEDPLTDAHFFKSHRRAERKEKQLRNIERERAMHEKVQLERLLDGLQGHDWLKVLGITGITDGEAKKYEPKRDFFITEVHGLVDKFKQWKEQEKRQRMEKEEAGRREQESEEMETEESSVEPPSSDLNASAARQLQQETVNALKFSAASKPGSSKGKEQAPTSTPRATHVGPPSFEVPITSFYAKHHLRDAALGRSRSGRNVTAFGHPLPEMDEREFVLSSEYVTEDALRAIARERRRRKRASIADAASG